VETAADGESLLARYREALDVDAVYDAVILDLTIPGGMGGEEVVRRLTQMNPQAKDIASSGYSDSPIMADCERFGFSAVLKKPYKVEQLAGVLQNILQRLPRRAPKKEGEQTMLTFLTSFGVFLRPLHIPPVLPPCFIQRRCDLAEAAVAHCFHHLGKDIAA